MNFDLKEKFACNFIIALIIIYPLLFIWQGLDFTDTGYWLSNYGLIFSDPSHVIKGFNCYLSEVIGGMWLQIAGSFGLIGLRAAYVIVLYLICFFVFIILKDFFKKGHILLLLFISMVFITKTNNRILAYNILTSLFFTLSVLFVYLSIKTTKKKYIFLSGFIIGLNFFIRLPNVMGILLLSVLVYYKIRVNCFFKYRTILGCSSAGLISAFVVIFFTMFFFDHLHLYAGSVKKLLSAFINHGDSIHGSRNLINIFIFDCTSTLKIGLIVFLFYIFALIISNAFRCINNKYINLIMGILIGALCYLYIPVEIQELCKSLIVFRVWEYTGVLYIISIACFIYNFTKQNYLLEVVFLLGLICLVSVPLGSGNGIANSVYGMWLVLPLAGCSILSVKKIQTREFQLINNNSFVFLNSFLLIIILFHSLDIAWSYTYRDSTNREKMVYGIDHPKLRGVKTTKERAELVQELIDVIPQYVKKGDVLLAVDSIPLLYFLTDTIPFLNNSWPMLSSFSDSKFEASLDRAENSVNVLPVVVKPKSKTTNFVWPQMTDTDMPFEKRFENKRLILSRFIAKHNYRNVWENNFFEIWRPLSATNEGISKFYRYDYAYDDYLKLYKKSGGNQYKISFNNSKLNYGEMDIIDGLNQLDYLCLQGIRGEFSSIIFNDSESSMLRIKMQGTDKPEKQQSVKQEILQLGITKGMRGFDADIMKENECAFFVRARVSSNDYFEVFIQDKQKGWHRKKINNHDQDDKWHDYLIFKKIRGNISNMGCGIVWRPEHEDSFLDISTFNLIVGSDI